MKSFFMELAVNRKSLTQLDLSLILTLRDPSNLDSDLVSTAFNRLEEVVVGEHSLTQEHLTETLVKVVAGKSRLRKLVVNNIEIIGEIDEELVKQAKKKIVLEAWVIENIVVVIM